jgi:plastocyanin
MRFTRRRIITGAFAVLALGAIPVARAVEPGPTSECTVTNNGDRSTSVLTPGSTLNQVSVWASADTGPDEVGAHVEPWHRQAYFADAGAGTDGSAAANAAVNGDDGEGAAYAQATASSDGSACVASPTAGTGGTTGDGAGGDGGLPVEPPALPPVEPPGGGGGGAAPVTQAVVAGPAAQNAGYVNRVVVLTAGSSLDFQNADTAFHDVTSSTRDASGNPLFKSATIFLPEKVPVTGVEALAAGTYSFYCSVHPNMQGTLAVQ